jgi:hypothetical protein
VFTRIIETGLLTLAYPFGLTHDDWLHSKLQILWSASQFIHDVAEMHQLGLIVFAFSTQQMMGMPL